jgi:hypothetical protein
MTPVHELHLVLGVSLLSLAASAYNLFHMTHGFTVYFDETVQSVKDFVREEVSAYVSSEIKTAQNRVAGMDRRVCSVCGERFSRFNLMGDTVYCIPHTPKKVTDG